MWLTEALAACQDNNAGYEKADVLCELARVLTAQGRHWEALEHIANLRRLDRQDPLPIRLCNKLDRAEIACRLAMRDLQGARLIIRSVPPSSWYPEALARLELLAGRPDQAEQALRAARNGVQPRRTEIERLVLLARVQFQRGRHDRAEGTLRRALELGRPERYVRVFLNDAPIVFPLLESIAGRHPDDYLHELMDKTRPSAPCGGTPPVSLVVESLSQRERDVLTLLPSHLTQREIAAAMYVSLNTVKTHTKAVYRKLGAASRSGAVQTARYHGLL